jgi:PAS domain S-box-containing protein
MNVTENVRTRHFLEDGGEMGALTRSFDWSQTSIGHYDTWPQSLQTTVGIILHSDFPMFLWWGDEMIQFYNDAYRPSLGLEGKHPKALGQNAKECWPEIWDIIHPLIIKVKNTGRSFFSEDQLIPIDRNGQREDVYWTFSYSAVIGEYGNIDGVLVVCNETTRKVQSLIEIKNTKIQLEQSEKNLKNVILQAPVAMCILKGGEHVVEIANERMLELWGKTAKDVINKPLFVGLSEAKDQGFEDLLNSVYTTGQTFTSPGLPVTLPRNGKLEAVYVNFVYEAFRSGEGNITGVMVVATDVTEQVTAANKIQESEEALKTFKFFADNVTDFIGICDIQGKPFYINDSGLKKVGLESDQIEEISLTEFFFPEDVHFVMNEFIPRVLVAGADETEIRFRHFKSGEPIWMMYNVTLLYDPAGEIIGLATICRDISEQRSFAEKLSKEVKDRTLELERKNNELEQFTYAASHDMQEPLRKVQAFISIIMKTNREQLDERGRMYLDKIVSSVARMKTIIDDLLNYSHQTNASQQLVPTDLNEVLANVEADLEMIIQKKAAVIVKDPLPVITVSPSQINQLFYNLINNSLKFVRPDSNPYIEIHLKEVNENDLERTKSLDPGKPYIKIVFSDNGIGFEPEYAENIFSLFTRLHGRSEYEGTGIGLALCKKIIDNHSGSIYAESTPGEGSRFHVILPLIGVD